jgi:hypothetical protein
MVEITTLKENVMVEIPTPSSGVGEKIRAIRDAEGLNKAAIL